MPGAGEFVEVLAHGHAAVGQVGESIEQVQMRFRLKQGVVLMLAVDMNQGAPYVGEKRER